MRKRKLAYGLASMIPTFAADAHSREYSTEEEQVLPQPQASSDVLGSPRPGVAPRRALRNAQEPSR